MITTTAECIFPLSPREEGGIRGLFNDDERIVVTDSTNNVARNTAIKHFEGLTDEQLSASGLHRSLVTHPDFIDGLLDVVRISRGIELLMEHDNLREAKA